MRMLELMALTLLAACATPMGMPPTSEAVRVTPTRNATWPAARGEAQIEVRAVTLGAAGAQQEVAGARCTASSTLYTAEFTAPARLLVPDFGPASPPVAVTCRAGEATGRAEARPEPYWSRGFGGWPAVGVSVGTGDYSGVGVGLGWYGGGTGWSGGSPGVRYPALRVVLR